MEEIISEKPSQRVRQKRTGDDEDREMKECLARLKVWQTENLMVAHGMDRVAKSPGKTKSGTIIKGVTNV